MIQRISAKVYRAGKRFLTPDLPEKIILLVSIQKSGTHLIDRVLQAAGLEKCPHRRGNLNMNDFRGLNENQYLVSHYAPEDDIQASLEESKTKVKVIFNFRDPRDVLVSWFHWVHSGNLRPMHSHMEYMQKVYKHFSDEELMDILIKNDKFRVSEYNPLEHFRHSRVLLFHPGVLNVRVEALVGSGGKGSLDTQLAAIKSVYKYLSIENMDIETVAKDLFSDKSPTFRKGQIGEYKSFLSEKQIDRFRELYGDILSQYGYT